MKKLLFILFSVASTASASFVPGPIQVNASGGTATAVGYATGGSSVPVSVLNTVTVSGTVTATPGAPGTAFPGVDLSTGVKANQGTASTSGWKIDLSTGVQVNGTITQGTAGTSGWKVDFSTGIQSRESLLVSSATALPAGVGNALQAQAMGDQYGRLVTMPIAPRQAVSVATATLTTSTAETIFISSPTAGTYNRLIGCLGENTSTTAADITFRQSGPATNNTGSFKLGTSVSNVPVGFFPPSGIPQTTFGNWTITGSASVTSLHLTCWYVNEVN